jgi:hypothetical protein
MRSFIYAMPILGAIVGTLVLVWTTVASDTAPQQAAGYAMACALAVVPYVFARAIDLSRDENESHRNRQTLALEKLARTLAPDKG